MSKVKFFRSTDVGAPQLFGAVGALIPVLDACLVDGYGSQSVFAMTHLTGTVTVTTTSSHGLASLSRQTISGANESGYNGDYIITVVNATQFTFTVAPDAISVNTATGTMLTKTGSAGWSKPFNTTNVGVYRPGAGLRHYFKVIDNTTIAARLLGFTSMSDVNTGVDQFPSTVQISGGQYWQKSTTTDGTISRPWIIIADDRTLYFWVQYGSTWDYNSLAMLSIGDFIPQNPGDLYASYCSANNAQSSYSVMYFGLLYSNIGAVTTSVGTQMYAPRSYSQLGSSAVLGKLGDHSKSAQGYIGVGGSLPYPHPVDGGLYQCPIGIAEGASVAANSVLRGFMRGVYNPLHNFPLSHGDIFEGNGDLLGKTFIVLVFCSGTSNLAQIFVDLSEEW